MAALNFPASPTVGQTFTAGGITWTWDGSKWTGNGLSQAYLPIVGGTMQGPLTLAANPVGNLDAATKQYVDAGEGGANRIINGDMRIDQRNNGADSSAIGYTADRWAYYGSQTGKGHWQRTGPGSSLAGFPYALYFTSSSAYASVAADTFELYQPIEADMISDFAWGTPSAQPVTLSFWAWSTLAGTFSGAINNFAQTRSYPFSYSLAANTWAKIVITIPGDTGGTWVMSGNAGSAYVIFDLGSGSSHRGPANAWASALYTGVTGSVSIVGNNNAAFQVTGVKLEIGSVATPFNRQSLAKSMADCQRYYSVGATVIASYGLVGGVIVGTCPLPATMRASPTITPTHSASSNMTGTYTIGIPEPRGNCFYDYGNVTANGAAQYQINWMASAEL